MDIAIHTNPSMQHQVRYAKWFRQGFAKHGLNAEITISAAKQADLHVVLGPHYALNYWLNHPNVIWLDRCYYKGDPEHVSLSWLTETGGRLFKQGEGKSPPEIMVATGDKTIFLAEFRGKIEVADIVRYHPADRKPERSLESDLLRCNKAIGYNTSALVTAGLFGLEVECKSDACIMHNENWHQLLPYADWHYTEIQNGEAWAHLKS